MRPKKSISRLTEFRKSLGLSALELSTICGVDNDYWYYYERGKAETHLQSFLRMKELANQEGIDLDEYLFCEEQKKEVTGLHFTEVSSLRELRERLGLSQEAIAKACGITYRSWGRYERNDTDMLISTFIKIRDYARSCGIEWVAKSVEIKKNTGKVITEFYEKPSLRMCLQR